LALQLKLYERVMPGVGDSRYFRGYSCGGGNQPFWANDNPNNVAIARLRSFGSRGHVSQCTHHMPGAPGPVFSGPTEFLCSALLAIESIAAPHAGKLHRISHEGRHPGGGGRFINFHGCPDLNNASLVHHGNKVGKIEGFFAVMGDQNCCGVFLSKNPGNISR
jgi:hypothetical protein